MNRTSRWVVVLLAAGVLASAGQALAQDWPQWRGPNRDGKVGSFTAPEDWSKALTQKWKVIVGAGDATPALVGDKLYVFARQGEEEVVLCLDAATGKELWKDKNAAPSVSGPDRGHAGPRSSPAVADGKVVTLGLAGVVSCLNAADGKLLWRKDPYPGAFPRFHTASSPIVVDGLAVVQLGGGSKGGIVAFDLAGGDEKWRVDGEAAEYASPVLMIADGTKQVVALTAKSLLGIGAADGKILWQVDCAPQGRMAYNAATPIVDGQVVIVSGGGRGTMAVKVEKQGDGFAAKQLWANDQVGTQFNTPVLKDGKIFGLSNRGNLFCLSAADGKAAWTGSESFGRRGFGAIVDAGSVLLALPDDGQLVVYKPSDKEFSQVAKIKAAESATYPTPVLSGNRIFVKDQDALVLWTVD